MLGGWSTPVKFEERWRPRLLLPRSRRRRATVEVLWTSPGFSPMSRRHAHRPPRHDRARAGIRRTHAVFDDFPHGPVGPAEHPATALPEQMRKPVIDMWAPFVPSAEVAGRSEGLGRALSAFEVFTRRDQRRAVPGSLRGSLNATDFDRGSFLDDAGITRSSITDVMNGPRGVTFVHVLVPPRPPSRSVPSPSPAAIIPSATRQSTSSSAAVEHGFRRLSCVRS